MFRKSRTSQRRSFQLVKKRTRGKYLVNLTVRMLKDSHQRLTYRKNGGFQVTAVKNETGNSTNGEKRKEVAWGKRDKRNLNSN